MSSMPSPVDRGELPIACSLGPGDGAERMRRWRVLVGAANPIASRGGRILEVRFQPGAGILDELVALAAAEQECCSFVTWTVTDDAGTPVLRVLAKPDSPDDVARIASLFGAPGRWRGRSQPRACVGSDPETVPHPGCWAPVSVNRPVLARLRGHPANVEDEAH